MGRSSRTVPTGVAVVAAVLVFVVGLGAALVVIPWALATAAEVRDGQAAAAGEAAGAGARRGFLGDIGQGVIKLFQRDEQGTSPARRWFDTTASDEDKAGFGRFVARLFAPRQVGDP